MTLTSQVPLTTRIPMVAGALALAGVAMAHSGHGHGHAHVHAGGLAAGLLHPAGGLDHLLAMVAVGVLGASRGGRMRWALPVAFLAAMAAGGALGMAGVALPMLEAAIASSVILLGAALMAQKAIPAVPAIALVAVAALFHGCAHGTELPANAAVLPYAAGFLLSTAALHGAGLAIGLTAQRLMRDARAAESYYRLVGAPVALAGVYLLVVAM